MQAGTGATLSPLISFSFRRPSPYGNLDQAVEGQVAEVLLLPLLASEDQQVLLEPLCVAVIAVAAATAVAVAGAAAAAAVVAVVVVVVIGVAVATVVVIVVTVT